MHGCVREWRLASRGAVKVPGPGPRRGQGLGKVKVKVKGKGKGKGKGRRGEVRCSVRRPRLVRPRGSADCDQSRDVVDNDQVNVDENGYSGRNRSRVEQFADSQEASHVVRDQARLGLEQLERRTQCCVAFSGEAM